MLDWKPPSVRSNGGTGKAGRVAGLPWSVLALHMGAVERPASKFVRLFNPAALLSFLPLLPYNVLHAGREGVGATNCKDAVAGKVLSFTEDEEALQACKERGCQCKG